LYQAVSLDRFKAILGIPQGPGGLQVVDFDATVTLNLAGHTIYRRVVERRRYGLTFISPLKPWDRVSVAILNHTGIMPLLTKKVTLTSAITSALALTNTINFLLPKPGECVCPPESPCCVVLPGTVVAPSFIPFGKAPDLTSDLKEKLRELEQKKPGLDETLAK